MPNAFAPFSAAHAQGGAGRSLAPSLGGKTVILRPRAQHDELAAGGPSMSMNRTVGKDTNSTNE